MQSCKQFLTFITLLGVLLLVSPVTGNDDTREVSRTGVSKYLTNEKILGEGRAPERCSEKVNIIILLNKSSLTNIRGVNNDIMNDFDKMKYKCVRLRLNEDK